MRISEFCAECLFEKQEARTQNAQYLSAIRKLLDERSEDITAPYMIYLFQELYRKYVGPLTDYTAIKKSYNDLVLSMEEETRQRIEESEDPLMTALFLARVGNYIDFGAMKEVDTEVFLSLFDNITISDKDYETYEHFLNECAEGRNFLLITDNCGEIVFDKLMLEQLHKRFPHLSVTALVRGEQVLNDATLEDARYVGLDRQAKLVSNGKSVAGTVCELLPSEAKEVLDQADVILAKGQGNYESLAGQGRHIFYAFLCKCELFTERFQVEKLTGMFVEEK